MLTDRHFGREIAPDQRASDIGSHSRHHRYSIRMRSHDARPRRTQDTSAAHRGTLLLTLTRHLSHAPPHASFSRTHDHSRLCPSLSGRGRVIMGSSQRLAPLRCQRPASGCLPEAHTAISRVESQLPLPGRMSLPGSRARFQRGVGCQQAL